MSRRINYPWDVLQHAGVGPARHVDDEVVVRGEEQVDAAPADQYGERLLKYVPAEAVALFVAVTPLADSRAIWWTALIVGGVIVVFTVPDLKAMTWWTIPLSLIAFVAWTFGTTQIDETLFGISPTWSALTLTFSAFLIPLVDTRLSALFASR